MKTVRNSILFLLSIFLFSNLSATFQAKLQNRSMRRSLNSGLNRYTDSSDLSKVSRATMISNYRQYGINSLDLEFVEFTKDKLFLELCHLKTRLESYTNNVVSSLRFYGSEFGLREVELLVNILVNNVGCILSFSSCHIDDIAAENLYSILKMSGFNLDMDLYGIDSDDEDEVNDFVNEFIEDLNSEYPIEFKF